METTSFEGLHPNALTHKLTDMTYTGLMGRETVTETWYRLTPDEAAQSIEPEDFVVHTIAKARELPGGWVKLITHAARDVETQQACTWWSVSLRPYLQGYGCDGTTNGSVHALAQRLTLQHSLDYAQLLRAAYPRDTASTADFNWWETDAILSETFIPPTVDPVLVLHDLTQINYHALVDLLAERLLQLGVLAENWEKDYWATFDARVQQIRAAYCATLAHPTPTP